MQLNGLKTTPIYSYLSAIALVRLVPGLRGWWEGNSFCVDASWEELSHYLLEEYVPSPILTPWNKSGGWLVAPKSKGNVKHVEAYRSSTSPRLAAIRETVEVIDREIAPYLNAQTFSSARGWASEDDKAEFVARLRASAPDAFLAWLDTVYGFLPEKMVSIPLAGKAGSEGTGEYSKTFGDALFALIDPNGVPKKGAKAALRALLFAESAPVLEKVSPGLYDPSSGGMGRDFRSGSLLEPQGNPWGIILALEGAIAFASRPSNRLDGIDPGSPSLPFSVRGSKVGYSSAADKEDLRLELWLPVWNQPLGKVQLDSLLRAGRSRLDDRPVREGLEFARALPKFAQRLPIQSLERYGILERASERGNAWACWLNTVYPAEARNADLLQQCELFVKRYARAASQRRLLERYFQVATGTRRLEDFLIDLGEAFADCDRHPNKYGEIAFPRLGREWARRLLEEDNSPEARLAIGLSAEPSFAKAVGDGKNASDSPAEQSAGGAPTKVLSEQEFERKSLPHLRWSASEPIAALIDFNRAWALRAAQSPGWFATRKGTVACLGDVARFVRGETHDRRIWALARGLRAVDTSNLTMNSKDHPLPSGFAAIALCWHRCRLWGGDLPYEGAILTGLIAGRSRLAIATALRRLRAVKIRPVLAGGYDIPPSDCRRWAAALAFPLGSEAITDLPKVLVDQDKNDENKF